MAEILPKARPAPSGRVPFWLRLGWWQVLAGGAVAAAVLEFAPAPGPGPHYTAEIVSDGRDFRVLALLDKARDEVILTRTAGATPEKSILQARAHGSGEPAQSIGLWTGGENMRLHLPPEIAAVRGTLTSGISEEPPTGSPLGRVFETVNIPDVASAI